MHELKYFVVFVQLYWTLASILSNQMCQIRVLLSRTSDIKKICCDWIKHTLANLLSNQMWHNPVNKSATEPNLRFTKRCCDWIEHTLANLLSNQMCHNPVYKSAFAPNLRYIKRCCVACRLY